jgi:RND superfamily putative drug exporter
LLKAAYDPRELNPIQIVAETKDSVWEADSIRQVQAYEERLKRVSGVKSVQSYVDAAAAIGAGGGAGGGSAAGTPRAEQTAALLGQAKVRKAIEGQQLAKERTALLVAVTATGPDDTATDDVVRAIRKLDAGGLQVLVTGGPAYRLDVMDRIQKNEPFVLAFVMCVTYVVLLFAFRSVFLPLKAVLMNVLSLGASLGMVVRVFQYGDLADVLHITSTGYVSATLPVIIFCVVFGISMDYEVFLISRIMEEYAATGDNERSTTVGLKKTGSLITSAAFILIVVVGSFLFTDIEIMKALGLGLAMAVLVDATIVRVALVPALMKLLGKANWWAPRWLLPL